MRQIILILVGLAFCAALGCSQSPSDPSQPGEQNGILSIRLTDAPVDRIDALFITFAEISAHIDGQWLTVMLDTITVDLLEWNNGNSIEIGRAELPAGMYTQIRLKIASASVVIDGETHPVTIPSNAQTGLKLITQFTLPEGLTFELVLDFDAKRSVVATGPPTQRRFKLKPTIRAVPSATTGSISGSVTNPEHLPVAFAIADGDTTTSAPVDSTDGTFRLAFLPEDTYNVVVADTTGQTAVRNNVDVTVGSDVDIGALTLN